MCLTKRLLSEPLFSVGTGVQEFNRYPSTVNRQPCSCLMQWSDRELTAFTLVARQTLTYKALNCAGSPVYLSRALLWKTSTCHYDHLVVSWLCRVPGGVSGTDPSMLQLPEFGMTCRNQSNSMPLSVVSTVT